MNTIRYLSDPALRELFLPGVVTALAIAALCSLLSVLVVLKRLAFIGQGVSHAAFGGVGIAASIGLVATSAGDLSGLGAVGQFAVIAGFCLGAALLIGWMSERSGTHADTAIGIVLVVSMALGAILIQRSKTGVAWETFLFGSLNQVGWADAWIAWTIAIGVLVTLWWTRRRLVFWAFDPVAASAMGIRARAQNLLLMTMLALATVTAMKLAGVVLATAMLVLPGAAALKVSARSGRVLVLAAAAALAGVVGGLVLSFEADLLPGPAIVCVLAALFVCGQLFTTFRSTPARSGA